MKKSLTALLVLGVMLAAVSAAQAGAGKARTQTFDGGLVVSNASGPRKVMGSVVAARGVFNGIGRIVERPNKAGEGENISRDDLVFADGTIHIVNLTRHASFSVNSRTCVGKFKSEQTTTIEGGTGRFAGATGRFTDTGTGSGVARRKPDGSCDRMHPPLVEIDTISMTGTLTL